MQKSGSKCSLDAVLDCAINLKTSCMWHTQQMRLLYAYTLFSQQFSGCFRCRPAFHLCIPLCSQVLASFPASVTPLWGCCMDAGRLRDDPPINMVHVRKTAISLILSIDYVIDLSHRQSMQEVGI